MSTKLYFLIFSSKGSSSSVLKVITANVRTYKWWFSMDIETLHRQGIPGPRVLDPAGGSGVRGGRSDPRGTWSRPSRAWCRGGLPRPPWSCPPSTGPAATCSSGWRPACGQRKRPGVNVVITFFDLFLISPRTLSKLELVQAGENPLLTLLTRFLSNPDWRMESTLDLSSVPWNTIW